MGSVQNSVAVDFSFSSFGWRRGSGRGGVFGVISPLFGPLPARSSRREEEEIGAARESGLGASAQVLANTSFKTSMAMSQRTPSQRAATVFNSEIRAARVSGWR